ncbi:MAG: hypothetical protein AAB877_00830 [Patescibacteria group bacterium]
MAEKPITNPDAPPEDKPQKRTGEQTMEGNMDATTEQKLPIERSGADKGESIDIKKSLSFLGLSENADAKTIERRLKNMNKGKEIPIDLKSLYGKVFGEKDKINSKKERVEIIDKMLNEFKGGLKIEKTPINPAPKRQKEGGLSESEKALVEYFGNKENFMESESEQIGTSETQSEHEDSSSKSKGSVEEKPIAEAGKSDKHFNLPQEVLDYLHLRQNSKFKDKLEALKQAYSHLDIKGRKTGGLTKWEEGILGKIDEILYSVKEKEREGVHKKPAVDDRVNQKPAIEPATGPKLADTLKPKLDSGSEAPKAIKKTENLEENLAKLESNLEFVNKTIKNCKEGEDIPDFLLKRRDNLVKKIDELKKQAGKSVTKPSETKPVAPVPKLTAEPKPEAVPSTQEPETGKPVAQRNKPELPKLPETGPAITEGVKETHGTDIFKEIAKGSFGDQVEAERVLPNNPREMAVMNLRERGYNIVKVKEARPRLEEKIKKSFENKDKTEKEEIQDNCFAFLPDKEKRRVTMQKGPEKGKIDRGRMDIYLKRKRDELDISEGAFNILIKKGYRVDNMKRMGFWKQTWGWLSGVNGITGKIYEIPSETEEGIENQPYTQENLDNLISQADAESLKKEANKKVLAKKYVREQIEKGRKIFQDEIKDSQDILAEREILKKIRKNKKRDTSEKQKEGTKINLTEEGRGSDEDKIPSDIDKNIVFSKKDFDMLSKEGYDPKNAVRGGGMGFSQSKNYIIVPSITRRKPDIKLFIGDKTGEIPVKVKRKK